MAHLALVVALIRDEDAERPDEKMKLIIAERIRANIRSWSDQSILELPSTLAIGSETMEETAARALYNAGYEANRFVYLSEGAIQPEASDQIASFFLGIDVKRSSDLPTLAAYTAHEVPIIHIGQWVYDKKLMVAPTVWAGIYLRISYLVAHPMQGSIQ